MAWLVTWSCQHCNGMGGDSFLFRSHKKAQKLAKELNEGSDDVEIERVKKSDHQYMVYED